MGKIFLLAMLSVLLGLAGCNNENRKVTAQNGDSDKKEESSAKGDKTPILVELFTSEGWSSCPPADRVLAKLQTEQHFENAEIITLAFHVDYWNYLGWKDEFSSAKYSQRQNAYSKALGVRANYTPQMIVDGDAEFVGSKEAVAKSEIAKASKNEKAKIDLVFDKENSELEIKADEISISEDAEILLAIAEDDLETSVKAGENSGRKLKHVAVVRDFQKIGELDKGKTILNKTSTVEFKSDWKMENLRLVVFVQSKKSKKVFAIGQIKFWE